MQKTKCFTSFYYLILFFCSKRCKIKLNTLLDYEDHNGRELQNIARNHSADIYCKDFMKIYREWTRESFDFFTIDATLSASNPLR